MLPVPLAQPPSPGVDCLGHVIWKLGHHHLSSTCQFDSGKNNLLPLLPFFYSHKYQLNKQAYTVQIKTSY